MGVVNQPGPIVVLQMNYMAIPDPSKGNQGQEVHRPSINT